AAQAQADDLLQVPAVRQIMKANFVWDLPDLKSRESALRAVGFVVNDWQLSGIWTASTEPVANPPSHPYAVNYSYQSGGSSVNLTGSPDYGARIRIVGDPGSGVSRHPHRALQTPALHGD